MINNIDAVKRGRNSSSIANITPHKFGSPVQVSRRFGAMYLLDERIQDAHAMPFFYKCVDKMRADKTGSARN